MSVIKAKGKRLAQLRESAVSREVFIHILYFLAGVLVSRGAMLGSMSPFGASFVAAIPFSYLPAGAMGCALSYVMLAPVESFRYVAVVVAIGAIRWVLNEIKRLSSARFFPCAVAFVPVFATGIALTFSSRSEVSEIYECAIEAVLAAAGAYFMSRTVLLMSSKRALTGFSQQELACVTMSGCILLLSASPLHIGSVNIGRLLAILSVMIFARYGMVKGGSVAGIATGIVFSLADTDLLFLSAGYSLSGLIGGLMAPMGRAAVAFSALLCNAMMAFGAPRRELTVSVVLETAAAVVILLLIPRSAGNYISSVFSDEKQKLSDEAVRRCVTMRLSYCSRALENVSSCVNSVSERLIRMYKPGLDRVYDSAAEYTCRSCGLRVYCWEKQREMTLDDMRRLGDILSERGYVKESDVDDLFLKRCCKSSELARSVNRAYKEHLSLEAANRRVTQVRSVVAGQFAGLSEILEDLSQEFEETTAFDTEASERIIAALSAAGLMVTDCSCRRRAGRGLTVELQIALNRRTAVSKAVLAREAGKACGKYFSSPTLSFEGDRVRVTMSEMPLYDMEIGSAQHVCDNGELCGDCMNYFNNGEGSTVALLSDGMGSGGRAAVDANMAVSIMTKLCKAGLSYDCSLAVVNSSLMIKSEEESLATLDVVDFNQFTGRARLMKAGACTTFIRRSSKLLCKEMPSLPLGILNESRFIKEDVTLSRDDMVVMISDGVLIGSVEWLEKLIVSWRDGSAEELASTIVEEARKRRLNEHDDDITAIAMRVVENV